MSQQGMDGKRKLTAKDAITAGALGAVCIAIRFLFMLVGGASPYAWFATHFIDAILIGPVFMLLVAKIRKNGPFLITSLVTGLVLVSATWMFPITGLVGGILCELCLKAGQFQKKGWLVLGFFCFNLGFIGDFLPLWFMKESYLEYAAQMMDPGYMATMEGLLTWPVFGVIVLSILVWEQVSFTAPRGQITAITGHNGAGKTTLARCLCGLMKEKDGAILWDGKPASRKDRKRLGFLIMQDVNLQLFADSVLAEAQLGNDANEMKAMAALERMDLAQYAQAHPLALSGGQKQRLAIVDGCLSGKELVIFDEPTSGLDYAHMLEVSRLLQELAEQGLCVLVITHDGEFLQENGARVISWLPAN